MTIARESAAADTELARVLGEYADRLGRGETPDPGEYAARYPHLASTFRELGSVLGLIPRAAGPDAPPAVAGFRVVREIGRGGMGVVYEAVEEALGRRVALKALPPQAVAHPQYLDRFRREARAAAKLHHTHIVPVFGVGEQAGVHYYAMQFVEGESLAGFVARGADPPAGEARPRFAARVGRQIADALAHAHAAGVLHRDVKPGNVLLDDAGTPYLTDFGLAKLAGGDDLTGTGDFVGTLRYAAPEQLRNEFDARGDVYGLGATLYELATGRPPFDAADREALVKQITNTDPPRPRSIDPAIPRDLETVVLKALAKEPGRRYQSAAELADDLGRVLADEPVRARRVGPVGRGWRWCRRNPVVAGLTAAVVLALAGVAAAAGVGFVRTRDALGQSEQHREAAEAARARTRQALRALSDEVVEQSLARRAKLGDDERKFLATVERYYEEFAADPGGTPEARLDRADGLFRVGLLRHRLGSVAAAEAAYRGAADGYAGLAAEFPGEPKYRAAAARSRGNLGRILAEGGRPDEAGQTYLDAARALEELVTADPGAGEYAHWLAGVRGNLGSLRLRQNRTAEAEADFRAALRLQEDLASRPSPPAAVRRDLAASRMNLATALRARGRLADALTEAAAGAALFEQLAAATPDHPDVRHDYAQAVARVADFQREVGRPADAEVSYGKALALQRQLVAEFPAGPIYREGLAGTAAGLGTLRQLARRTAEATAAYQEAAGAYRRLARDDPDNPKHEEDLARVIAGLGWVAFDDRRPADAAPHFREAAAVRARQAEKHPGEPRYRRGAAAAYGGLGMALSGTKDLAGAETALRAALAEYERIPPAARLPEDDLRETGTVLNVAALRIDAGDGAAAKGLLDRAKPTLARLRGAMPANPQVRMIWRDGRRTTARVALAAGDHAAAAGAADEVAGAGADPAQDALAAARLLARGVTVARSDAGLPTSDREKTADRYAVRAVAFLRQAAAKGYSDAAALRADEELTPLRGRPDFQAVLADLSAKAGGRPSAPPK